MGPMDKFLKAMKIGEDDGYDDYMDDDYGYEDEPQPVPRREKQTVVRDIAEPEERISRKPSNKVMPLNKSTGNRKVFGNGMEVCVIKPQNVDDAREITETLLADRTVVLNLEGLDVEIAQRIIDFTSGSTFAIRGNLQKISNYIFIVTPASVDISGDFQEILSGSFDVASMRS